MGVCLVQAAWERRPKVAGPSPLSSVICDAPMYRRPACSLQRSAHAFSQRGQRGEFSRRKDPSVSSDPGSAQEGGFRPYGGGGPQAHHVRRRSPMHLRPHTLFPLGLWNSEGFPEFSRTDSFSERIRGPRGSRFIFSGPRASIPPPRPKTFSFLGVAGGTIERSCYSPHYVNTERD